MDQNFSILVCYVLYYKVTYNFSHRPKIPEHCPLARRPNGQKPRKP